MNDNKNYFNSIRSKLELIEQHINLKTNQNSWMSINRAAKYCDLSKSTIRRAIQNGQLKCAKTSGKILFKRGWLDQFIFFGKSKITKGEKKLLDDIL